MTDRFSVVFANISRSVFIGAERFCDAKINSCSLWNALSAD